jgi:protein involved in polysaccharide export with SLBB domain
MRLQLHLLIALVTLIGMPGAPAFAQLRPARSAETAAPPAKTPAPRKPIPLPAVPPFQGEPQLLRGQEGDEIASLLDDSDTAVDPEQYRLGPGDQLSVGITARTPAAFTLSVSPVGQVFLPAVGDVKVAGQTIREAQDTIAKALTRVRHTGTFVVSLRLTRLRRIRIQVLGEVEKPSVYRVGPTTRLLEALARAGGLTPIASRRHVELRRHGVTRQIDLEGILLRGDPTDNLLLEAEDLLFVPRARAVVALAGEVNRPGDYECDPGDTVASLLERAGGARASGALSAIEVERPETGDRRRLHPVDLTAAASRDFVLQDRDRVVVPSIARVQGRLRVLGAVAGGGEGWLPDQDAATPRVSDVVTGTYLLRRGERVRDVIENLGGVTAKADSRVARIERPDGSGGKQVIPVDLHRALVLQEPDQNPELQDGDTLIVPKKQDRVYVLGDVSRAGEQEYVEGKSVLDYVGAAGGPGPRAKRKETVIVRTIGGSAPSAGEQQILPAHLDQYLAGKKPKTPVTIQPGDIIVVPSATIRGWQELAQLIFTVRSLTTGLFLFR